MIDIRKFWRKNFIFCESMLAVFIGACVFIWVVFLNGCFTIRPVLDGNRSAIYGALASIFGSLLGFTITAESIVLSVSGHANLESLRKSKHYETLWNIFIHSVRCLGIATFGALVGLILDRDKDPLYWLFSLNFGLFLLGIFSLVRSIWILEIIIGIVIKSGQNNDD